MEPRRIAVLFHESDNEESAKTYIVSNLAKIWREDGHVVFNVFGVSSYVPADLLIVHVDLSVVPAPYLDFARRYPIVINGQIADIRKSTFSTAIVKPGEQYNGLVIVKTDLNYAGMPEFLRLGQKRRHQMDTPLQYKIFRHINLVPPAYRLMPELIIEKFLPEIDNGMFCVRSFRFLGKNGYGVRMKSTFPIVNSRSEKISERIEPDEEIMAMRVKLKMDYGKLDYVVFGGRSILLDANKTMGVGAGQTITNPDLKELQRFRAEGLYGYFDPSTAQEIAPWSVSATIRAAQSGL